jgi:hypothetical protein
MDWDTEQLKVKWFHRTLPVIGEARSVSMPDGDSKFWFVACPHDGQKHGITMRTIGTGTIQERLEHFLTHDAWVLGYDMIWADHVRPATEKEISDWIKVHMWLYWKAA